MNSNTYKALNDLQRLDMVRMFMAMRVELLHAINTDDMMFLTNGLCSNFHNMECYACQEVEKLYWFCCEGESPPSKFNETICRMSDIFDEIAEHWPKNTAANFLYPVPAPADFVSSDNDIQGSAFKHFKKTIELYSGEYGKSRLELLDYVIDQLIKHL